LPSTRTYPVRCVTRADENLPPVDPGGRVLIAQLAIPATFVAVRDALAALMAGPLLADVAADDRGMAELVLAEALNNIVEHAYADCPGGEITLTLWQSEGEVACRITDRGTAMPDETLPDGLLAPHGDTADLPEGGFGWHLIRTLSRDLRYARLGTLNELTFVLCSERSPTTTHTVSA
jgi:serine/threonine-protein kinase RsbW